MDKRQNKAEDHRYLGLNRPLLLLITDVSKLWWRHCVWIWHQLAHLTGGLRWPWTEVHPMTWVKLWPPYQVCHWEGCYGPSAPMWAPRQKHRFLSPFREMPTYWRIQPNALSATQVSFPLGQFATKLHICNKPFDTSSNQKSFPAADKWTVSVWKSISSEKSNSREQGQQCKKRTFLPWLSQLSPRQNENN